LRLRAIVAVRGPRSGPVARRVFVFFVLLRAFVVPAGSDESG